MEEQIEKSALEYHRFPRPGKISILPTVQLTNQRDFGLAYSPGVAAACEAIGREPAHLLTPPATVRRIVNTTALAAVDASQASQPQA